MLIISDGMRVPVHGDIDVATEPGLRRHLARLIEGGCTRITLDLADVDFVDSTGAALILTTARSLRREGGLLTLENVPANVLRTFKLWHIADFIPVVPRTQVKRAVRPLSRGAVPRWHLGLLIEGPTLGEARERLRQMLVTLPRTEEEIFDVTLAAGEAMGNTILHTPGATGKLSVTAYDDRVVIEAIDDGPGFSIADDEEVETTYEHGRGIKMMRMLVDSVDISKKRFGSGTVATLTKIFAPRPEQVATIPVEATALES